MHCVVNFFIRLYFVSGVLSMVFAANEQFCSEMLFTFSTVGQDEVRMQVMADWLNYLRCLLALYADALVTICFADNLKALFGGCYLYSGTR